MRLLPVASPLPVSGRAVSDNSLRLVLLPCAPGQTAPMQTDDTPGPAVDADAALTVLQARVGDVSDPE